MPFNTVDKRIGENDYQISTLPFSRGRKLIRFAASIVARAGSGLEAQDAEGLASIDAIGIADIARAISMALDVVTDEEMERITKLIGNHSKVRQGDKWPLVSSVAEEHFAGRIGEWGMWVYENVKLNGGDFLDMADLGGALGSIRTSLQSASQSQ